jgi:ABC-type Fe3+-hydroxamate transport system substrate-binding protein
VKRRTLLAGLALGAIACRRSPPASSAARIVSLAPGITDTLFAIGAGAQLVARSDYCDFPSEVERLPKAGTSLTPNYELITRLAPSLIVGEDGAAARRRELEALGPTLLLPWLTLAEIVNSVRELGRRTGRNDAAASLADRMQRELGVAPPADGPRVLLVIGYQPGDLDEVWFIRENSLHASALHAAGARNAVTSEVAGLPRLSPEQLVAVDPDGILILALPGKAQPEALRSWQQLKPLRAIKNQNIEIIEAPEAYVHGPRILTLVDRLAVAVKRMRTAR